MLVVEVGNHSIKHRVGLLCVVFFFFLITAKSRVFQRTLAQPITVFTLQRQKPEDFCSADQYLEHISISNLGVNFLALRNALYINFHLA